MSDEALLLYKQATSQIPRHDGWYANMDILRDDPILIQIIEKIGLKAASGGSSELKIIEIPADIPNEGWIIQEYDGIEWVAERHRTWN